MTKYRLKGLAALEIKRADDIIDSMQLLRESLVYHNFYIYIIEELDKAIDAITVTRNSIERNDNYYEEVGDEN